MSVVLYSGRLSPELCQANPDKIFVFGDNLMGIGMGGQAIIRNEKNAFGVPTKRLPSMADKAFFVSGSESDLRKVLDALGVIWAKLKGGATVVIPVNEHGAVSLGMERAKLITKAPEIYDTIRDHVEEMCDVYGKQEVADDALLYD